MPRCLAKLDELEVAQLSQLLQFELCERRNVRQVTVLIAPAKGRISIRHPQQHGPITRESFAEFLNERDKFVGRHVFQYIEKNNQVKALSGGQFVERRTSGKTCTRCAFAQPRVELDAPRGTPSLLAVTQECAIPKPDLENRYGCLPA